MPANLEHLENLENVYIARKSINARKSENGGTFRKC